MVFVRTCEARTTPELSSDIPYSAVKQKLIISSDLQRAWSLVSVHFPFISFSKHNFMHSFHKVHKTGTFVRPHFLSPELLDGFE
jgi:hypothetical protein